MNKMLVLVLVIAMVSVVSVTAATMTVVSGHIYDSSASPVAGATVEVTCNGHLKSTTSGPDGFYSTSFPASQCTVDDSVSVHASKDDKSGDNTGTVVSGGRDCVVDVSTVDVTIPEFATFGLIAAALAGLGIVAYKRR